MDLEKARHLVALADHGTFNRAAIAVELTQPAFSRSIRALERELGVQLVDRGARASRLTPYGEVVVQRARILLRGLREATRDLELLKRGEVGRVAVGFAAPAAACVLAPWLATLAARGTSHLVHVETGDTAQLLQRLRDEALDAVVGEGRTLQGEPDLECDALGTATTCLAVRAGHPLLDGGEVTLAHVGRHPIGTSTMPPAFVTALEERLGVPAGTLGRRLRVTIDDFALLRTLALESDLVLGTTTRVIRDDLAAGRLVRLPLPGVELESRTAIAWLAGRTLPAVVAQLAALARERLA